MLVISIALGREGKLLKRVSLGGSVKETPYLLDDVLDSNTFWIRPCLICSKLVSTLQ